MSAPKVAFVAGAMGGMGTAICQSLARNGLRVIAGCAPHFRFKDEWLAMQRAQGFDFHAEEFENADGDELAAVLDRIEREVGPLEVLVNNAEMTELHDLAALARRARVVSIEAVAGAYRTHVWMPPTQH